jgi:hypothetical protein
MAITRLVAKYVLMDKLKTFLKNNFIAGNYSTDVRFPGLHGAPLLSSLTVVQISDDYVEVTAPRELTEVLYLPPNPCIGVSIGFCGDVLTVLSRPRPKSAA